ncbi:MAG: hypothetical protein Q3971_04060 [Moraxella sp.]|nr:hypothetical protein [Moraxella sp.]
MHIDKNAKKKIFDISHGSWLSGLFSAIPSFIPNITFSEHKQIFFKLVEEWLNDGKIKFDYPPLEQYAGKTGFWDADNATIMAYLQDGFPKHATDELDMDVNLYFYEIAPPVCWL